MCKEKVVTKHTLAQACNMAELPADYLFVLTARKLHGILFTRQEKAA
jgi:hypothetical protein